MSGLFPLSAIVLGFVIGITSASVASQPLLLTLEGDESMVSKATYLKEPESVELRGTVRSIDASKRTVTFEVVDTDTALEHRMVRVSLPENAEVADDVILPATGGEIKAGGYVLIALDRRPGALRAIGIRPR